MYCMSCYLQTHQSPSAIYVLTSHSKPPQVHTAAPSPSFVFMYLIILVNEYILYV